MGEMISFGELKKYVDMTKKECAEPSLHKLITKNTPEVISIHTGRFENIKIVSDDRILFKHDGAGHYEEIRIFPLGGKMGKLDMSVYTHTISIKCEGDVMPVYELTTNDNSMAMIINESADISEDAAIMRVFKDGHIYYRSGKRATVFSIIKCGRYTYRSREESYSVTLTEEYLDTLEWHIGLMMYGEDSTLRNILNHKKEITWNTINREGVDIYEFDHNLWNNFVMQYQMKEALRERISDIFDILDEKDRRIYEMYHSVGLTQAEIGRELGMARETVSRRMKAARRRLDDYKN